MSNTIKVETTITQKPFRCVVCGYLNSTLVVRRETSDPWKVMKVVDEVHDLMMPIKLIKKPRPGSTFHGGERMHSEAAPAGWVIK